MLNKRISTKSAGRGAIIAPLFSQERHARSPTSPPPPPPPPPPPLPLLTGLLSIGSLSYIDHEVKKELFFFLCRKTDGSREQKGSFFPLVSSLISLYFVLPLFVQEPFQRTRMVPICSEFQAVVLFWVRYSWGLN